MRDPVIKRAAERCFPVYTSKACGDPGKCIMQIRAVLVCVRGYSSRVNIGKHPLRGGQLSGYPVYRSLAARGERPGMTRFWHVIIRCVVELHVKVVFSAHDISDFVVVEKHATLPIVILANAGIQAKSAFI